MRMINRSFIVTGSVTLAASLLLVQVCSTICLLSGCGVSPKNLVTQQTKTKQQSHCHPSPAAPAQPPANDSHQCPNHDSDALQSANYLQADVIDQLNLQPVLAEPFFFAISLSPSPQAVSKWKPLRSPPLLAQRAILRI